MRRRLELPRELWIQNLRDLYWRSAHRQLRGARAVLRARETPSPAGSARDPSAAADDATPAAPAGSADSGPDGSSGEVPAATARDAEDPSP